MRHFLPTAAAHPENHYDSQWYYTKQFLNRQQCRNAIHVCICTLRTHGRTQALHIQFNDIKILLAMHTNSSFLVCHGYTGAVLNSIPGWYILFASIRMIILPSSTFSHIFWPLFHWHCRCMQTTLYALEEIGFLLGFDITLFPPIHSHTHMCP